MKRENMKSPATKFLSSSLSDSSSSSSFCSSSSSSSLSPFSSHTSPSSSNSSSPLRLSPSSSSSSSIFPFTSSSSKSPSSSLTLFSSSSSASSSSSSSSSSYSPFPSFSVSSGLHHRFWLCLLLLLTTRVIYGQPYIQLGSAMDAQVHKVLLPQPGVVGQSAQLECVWAAGSQGFYSVRWYKNGEQFYSFVPKNSPQVKVDHKLEGVSVELEQSDERVVTLRELRMDSGGNYKCEVMSEAPTFKSSFKSENMTVIVLPKAPELSGLQNRRPYRVSDQLNVTCTARDASPPAKLTFYLDDQPFGPSSTRVTELRTERGSYPGVYTSRTRLVVPLSSSMVPSLNVKCVSDVERLKDKVEVRIDVEENTGIGSFFYSGGSRLTPCLVTLVLALAAPAALATVPRCPS